jgi:hypothetical protein
MYGLFMFMQDLDLSFGGEAQKRPAAIWGFDKGECCMTLLPLLS